MTLVEDAEAFEEAAGEEDFVGMSKREVQTWMFRMKSGLTGDYDLEIRGTEMDFETKLVHEREGEADSYAELYIDTGGGVEVGAFVLGDDDRERYRFVEKR